MEMLLTRITHLRFYGEELSFKWTGHAGLYAGINSSHQMRQIAMVKVGTLEASVEDIPWSHMTSDTEYPYWGAYTLNNHSMTFSDRKNVMNTAVELIGYDIGYPLFNLWPNALDYYSNPGTYINPYEIQRLRCDGLVEYCYEFNDLNVWGKNGSNYDISITSNVALHNDCYHSVDQDPDENLSPIVQCGGHGNPAAITSYTNMTKNAVRTLPSCNASYNATNCTATVTISATDESGIHLIGYSLNGGSDWYYSPTQPQHPTSATYTYQLPLTITQSGYIYFYAIDNGGNQPATAQSIYIDLNSPATTTVSGSGTQCDGCITLFASGGSGGTIYYQGTTNNGTSTANPYSYQTVCSSGTYYFRSRSSAGCWGPQGSATVTINNSPAITIVSGGGTYCNSATLTASGGSGGTIYWQGTTSNGTSTATPATNRTVNSSGTYYFRSRSSAGCWGTQGSATVTINNSPSITIVSGGGTYCNSATLTASGGSGGTIYWQGTTSNGTSTTTPATSQTVYSSGTYYFRSYNSCGWGTQGSANVTINNSPAITIVSGGGTYCNSATLTASGGSGGTIYWQGTTSNGTSTTTPATNQTVNSSGTYYFRSYNSCGWGTQGSANVTLDFSSTAPTGATASAASVCSGSSSTLNVIGGSLGTGASWKWYSGNCGGTLVGTGSSISISPTTTTTYYVRAEGSCNTTSCASVTVIIIALPAQPGPITGSTSVCQGSSQTYSLTAVPNATSYTWTLPSGWSGTSSTNIISTTVGSNSGTITVTANNSCGSSAPSILNVNVTALPGQPGPITGSASVTRGSTVTYSIAAVQGATSYIWTLPSGWTGSSTTTSIVATAGPNALSGNITVAAINSCGQSQTSLPVVVGCNPPAQPGSITGSASVCQGASQTYTISPVTGATSYTWSLPNGWSGTSNTASINATAGQNAVSGTIAVTANNSCGSSTQRTLNVSVTNIPAQPGPITGSTSVCQGSSQTYSLTAVPNATSYTWTLPSGWSGTSSTNIISTTVGSNSGTITVTANNSCGSSAPSILNVNVTALPGQPGPITGSASVTRGSTVTYSIAAVQGATSYIWTLPSGWTGSSTTTSIVATAGPNALSGNITVAAINSCGQSQTSSLPVVVGCNPPAQPGSITGSASVCQGASQTYSISLQYPGCNILHLVITEWLERNIKYCFNQCYSRAKCS
jgi:large repetitive protein